MNLTPMPLYDEWLSLNSQFTALVVLVACQQDDLVRAALSGVAVSEAAARVSYLAGRQGHEAVVGSHPGVS